MLDRRIDWVDTYCNKTEQERSPVAVDQLQVPAVVWRSAVVENSAVERTVTPTAEDQRQAVMSAGCQEETCQCHHVQVHCVHRTLTADHTSRRSPAFSQSREYSDRWTQDENEQDSLLFLHCTRSGQSRILQHANSVLDNRAVG